MSVGRRPHLLVRGTALLAVLASLAGLLMFGNGCGGGNTTTTTEEVEIGHLGVARFNHFLAASRFLEEMGIEAKSVPSISELPDSTGALVLLPYDIANSKGMSSQIDRWVSNGGHAIVPVEKMPSSLAWYLQDKLDAWGSLPDDDDDETNTGTPLLDTFGVELVDRGFFTNRNQVAIRGDLLELALDSEVTFKVDRFPRGTYSNGDRWQSSFLSLSHGAGRMTFLAEPAPFTNRYLGTNDHARVLYRLAKLENATEAVFVYNDGGLSFIGMLLRYGWMPLLSLLALVVFWLLRNAPRFGPIARPEPIASRQFAEHVAASGKYLWEHDQANELLGPMRRRVQQKLRKRNLGLPHQQDPDEETVRAEQAKLAELTGLSAIRIDEAMSELPVEDSSMFVRVVDTLQTIDDNL